MKSIDYSDSAEALWIICDASDTGIGAALSHRPKWKTAPPIAFESQSYQGDEEKKLGEWKFLTPERISNRKCSTKVETSPIREQNLRYAQIMKALNGS